MNERNVRLYYMQGIRGITDANSQFSATGVLEAAATTSSILIVVSVRSGSGEFPFSGDKLPVGSLVLIARANTSTSSSSSSSLSGASGELSRVRARGTPPNDCGSPGDFGRAPPPCDWGRPKEGRRRLSGVRQKPLDLRPFSRRRQAGGL